MSESASGPRCDDVEFIGAKLTTDARGRGGSAQFAKFDQPPAGEEMWEQEEQLSEEEEDRGYDEDEVVIGEEMGEERLDDQDYEHEKPDFEDAEFHIVARLCPAELAVRAKESVVWMLKDLYSRSFNIAANKGMRDNASLGGISMLTMHNGCPFTIAWRMSLPEDSKKKSSAKSASEDDDRIPGYTYLGEHVPMAVHGVLAPNEKLEVETPCLTQPEDVSESFLSQEDKSHWTKEDMSSTANGVHYFRDRKGLVSLETDHPVAKMAEEYFQDTVILRENLTELTQQDLNRYSDMLIQQHKSNITLGDARKNLQIHFTRVVVPDPNKPITGGKTLDSNWDSESEICDSLSTADMEAYDKAKARILGKTYSIRARLLVQFSPKTNDGMGK